MGALKSKSLAALLAGAAVSGSAAHADPIARWRPIVIEAAARFALPAYWIERVILAESGGAIAIGGRPTRSKAGAIGLMQVMPATWMAMRARYGLGADPDDPHDNIVAGSAYLRLMYDRFGYPGLYAAYNAGPDRFRDYLAGRSRLPGETVAYLAGVTGGRSAGVLAATMGPRDFLFALRRDLPAPPQSELRPTSGDRLFAFRKAVP